MRALLIIDVQNDFLPGGSLAVPGGDEIVPVINELQHNFDLVVATQDWHPKGHSSFASQHSGKKPFDVIEDHGRPQTLWPDHCIQNTPGAELSAALDTRRVEAIFRKGTEPAIDSYSAFYDNLHLKSTGLADYLRGKGVTHTYLCGLAADVCVYFSALDSLREGFTTTLLPQATRPINHDDFAKQLEDLEEMGCGVDD